MKFSAFGKQIAITVPRQVKPEITIFKQSVMISPQPKPSFQVTPGSVLSAADRALCSLNAVLLRLQSSGETERTIVLEKNSDDVDVVTSQSQSDTPDDDGISSTVLWISDTGHKSKRKKKT